MVLLRGTIACVHCQKTVLAFAREQHDSHGMSLYWYLPDGWSGYGVTYLKIVLCDDCLPYSTQYIDCNYGRYSHVGRLNGDLRPRRFYNEWTVDKLTDLINATDVTADEALDAIAAILDAFEKEEGRS